MNELMVVANVAIVFGVIYKLFELYAGRKERMLLIEKLGDRLTPETFKNGIFYRPSLFSFGGLRLGCLLIGLGLGLLIGYTIVGITLPEYFYDEHYNRFVGSTVSVIYGASVLLGGGTGLVVAYIIEAKQMNKKI